MVDTVYAPWAILLLRVCLALMFIAHALLKWRVFTIPGTVAYFRSLGLPGWFAYVTIAAELAGATALLIGLWPRYAALLLTPLMLGTIVKVHGKNGWLFSNKDGGWEYPAFWTAALLAVFLLGDGRFVAAPSPALPGGSLTTTRTARGPAIDAAATRDRVAARAAHRRPAAANRA